MQKFHGRRLMAAASLVGVVAGIGFAAPATSAQAAVTQPSGLYHPATPKRLLDTRHAAGSVAAGSTVTVPRSAFTAAGVPASGVQSVVVNLTVTGPTGSGWAVAYSGSTVPATSNINFAKGWTGANRATVALTSAGLTVRIGGAAGTRSQVIVDLQGWYGDTHDTVTGGSSLLTGEPFRFADTRTKGGPIKAGATNQWPLGLSNGDLPFTPTSILVNLTATGATGTGSLTAWSGAGAKPGTSNLNFAKGETSPNTAIIPVRKVGSDYQFAISNTGWAPTNYIVDMLGVFGGQPDQGMLFGQHVMLTPARVMSFAPIGANRTAQASLGKYIDSDSTLAVEGNLTVVGPTAASYQTAYAGTARPPVSALNVAPGMTRANGVLIASGEDLAPQAVTVYNSAGSIKAIVDVTGRFDVDYSTLTPAMTPALRPGLRTPVSK